ncbi:MAG: type I restriction endonuclease subunit M [Betaproteobacteria bacterium]|nr:type I restriction endonuclease subunit M [Betaproteobacteria bacterium]
MESINGSAPPELTRFREYFARPLLQEYLGFELHENVAEPRLRALSIANGGGSSGPPVALVLMCPDPVDIDSRQARKSLDDGLLAGALDYGFLLSPEVLRLVRRPGIGMRGAALDLGLATTVELQDLDSLAAAYRVLSAHNFARGPEGARPLDLLEAESRKHSAKVSNDLKAAVFEAAERIVGGFLEDVRSGGDSLLPPPGLAALRDAGFLALYRLLFILYAEARDERLIGHRLYQRSYSLDGIITRLLRTAPESLAANRHGLWMHVRALFRIFNEGIAPNLPDLENIPPRGGRLFSEDTPEGRLLCQLRLNDRHAAAIFLALGTTQPRRGVGRERVSFRELEIEQLGHVYEGLLEYEPAEALEMMIEVSVGGRDLALTPDEIVRLCEQKQLYLRGAAALVEGTAAAELHPELAPDDEEDEAEGEEEGEEEASEDAEEEEPSIKRGASLKLLRRIEPGEFFFKPGAARKSSGSYYTPTAMVDDLARHALRPLVDNRSAAEIERLRVIDIACGSGHFLVGAARFLGPKLFEAYRREHGGNPPPDFHPDRALSGEVKARWDAEGQDWCRRRMVEKCLFGVDLNPAAVQLAQVALWIESLAGDRPLSFFSHHIRCGNSLLGSSLARFDAPPDPQLGKPGDRMTRGLFETELRRKLDDALAERRLIDAPLPPEIRRDTPEEYAYKEDRLRRAEYAIAQAKLLLDLRSAAPFLPAIWKELPMLMSSFDLGTDAGQRPWWAQFEEVRNRERFFHWELEFPEVLLDTERPGFDAVLGNPPWDKVLPSKHEFYGQFDALIRAYKGNDLKRRIGELNAEHEGLTERFDAYSLRATTFARVLRAGGDFPLAEARSQAAHEDVAKYFVDRAIALVAKGGAAGLVVPSVFYSGDGWVGIRRYLLQDASIERFYAFENRKKIFPIHSSYKFVNLVARKDGANAGRLTAAFMRQDTGELQETGPKPWHVQITRQEIEKLSPDTLAFLEYRSSRDQEIVRKMYSGRPTLGGSGPGNWGATLFTDLTHELIYNSSRDKDLYTNPRTGRVWTPADVLETAPTAVDELIERMREQGFWPIFEGKHTQQFIVGIRPIRWWLSLEQAMKKYKRTLPEKPTLTFRYIARNTDARTSIAAVLPACAAASEKLTGVRLAHVDEEAAMTVFNSLCFDYGLRLRLSGTSISFTYILPMPVPPAELVNRLPRIPCRPGWGLGIGDLADDRAHWPSLWEANLAVSRAYGLTTDDFKHILGTFPVFTRKHPEFMEFFRQELSLVR